MLTDILTLTCGVALNKRIARSITIILSIIISGSHKKNANKINYWRLIFLLLFN